MFLRKHQLWSLRSKRDTIEYSRTHELRSSALVGSVSYIRYSDLQGFEGLIVETLSETILEICI